MILGERNVYQSLTNIGVSIICLPRNKKKHSLRSEEVCWQKKESIRLCAICSCGAAWCDGGWCDKTTHGVRARPANDNFHRGASSQSHRGSYTTEYLVHINIVVSSCSHCKSEPNNGYFQLEDGHNHIYLVSIKYNFI